MRSMTRPLPGLTIKAALVLGFSAIVGLWLVAGLQVTRRMADVQREAAGVNARYLRAQELLSTVRAQILLGSVHVRDALLDDDPATTTRYRDDFESAIRAAGEALHEYVPVLDVVTSQQDIERLRDEIAGFHHASLEVLASDRRLWPTQARLLLNSRVMPRRDTVVRIADDMQSFNRSAFVREQQAVALEYEDTQRRAWVQLGFALGVGLLIALAATIYVTRLERVLRRQRATEAQNALDLQRLSTALVGAQEEERRTIARELHDEVGQALTAIKVELSLAQRAIEGSGGSGQLLESAHSITDGALTTVRDLSRLLRPTLLDDLGLPAALEWYLGAFGSRHGIRVALVQDHMDARLLPDIEVAAYRIVQEALNNVAKHARASACRVYLRRAAATVTVTVEDNGSGFDAPQLGEGRTPHGLGLIGIRERVASLGGVMRLESARGEGTRLTVELPARVQPDETDETVSESVGPAAAPEVSLG